MVLNLYNMSPPSSYLKLFFTLFTFILIATRRMQTVKNLNYVSCNANSNTAVAIYEKIRKFLIPCSTMKTTYHIPQSATVFLFLLITTMVTNRSRINSTSSISLCLSPSICNFNSSPKTNNEILTLHSKVQV